MTYHQNLIHLSVSQYHQRHHCDWRDLPFDLKAERVAKAVTQYFGLTDDALSSRTRTVRFAWPRHLYCYLLATNMKPGDGASLCGIGRSIGRDHSTVISSVKAVRQALDMAPIVCEEGHDGVPPFGSIAAWAPTVDLPDVYRLSPKQHLAAVMRALNTRTEAMKLKNIEA